MFAWLDPRRILLSSPGTELFLRTLRATALAAVSVFLCIGVEAQPAMPRLAAARILHQRYGNDADWYRDRIPLFESSDPQLDAVYYYRWSLFRAHQRDLGPKGYITTEFLDDVSWQREPYASLNDATAFHLNEARWLRYRRFADDYIAYLYEDGGNDRHFSEAIADAVWARYLVDHDRDAAIRHLPAMRRLYDLWDDHFDAVKGLYWIEPLLDATEYSVASIDASGGKDGFRGGDAFRPSINSYMFANARAIARLSALAGDDAAAAEYTARGEALKAHVLQDLWSPTLTHFVDRYKSSNAAVRRWQPIRARELVGYLPWTFGMLDDQSRFDDAWRHLLSPLELAGPAGLRTVEPSYPYYMQQYRYDQASGGRECQWNGPVWPFQTTQVLAGLAHMLQIGPPQPIIGRGDYLRLLRQYARLHFQDGRLDLEEDYDPASGQPIVGLARSHHYFHSGFNDLIITGLAGIEPSAGNDIVIDPLIPDDQAADRLRYFALQDLPYHGHSLSLFFDEDGARYGLGKGLRLYVDGALTAARDNVGRLSAGISSRANLAINRPVNRATSLVRTDFPRAAASSGNDPERLHDAIDGRISFYPEAPNGWESTSTASNERFEVDFGHAVPLHAVELAFYAGEAFAAPRFDRIEALIGNRWVRLLHSSHRLRDNGISRAEFLPIQTRRLRILFEKSRHRQIRLVELKVF